MNTVDEYMRLPYRMEFIPEPDEGGYAVRFPELPGCITAGETLNEAFENAIDAKRAWIEAAQEQGIAIPKPGEYSGQYRLRMPRSLHRSLAEHAREEGISLNQYCIYLLSKYDAAYLPASDRA